MADRKHDATFAIPALMEAVMFAAKKHRDCRRKDAHETPYINHPIEVANILATVGKIDDIEILQAALLHDTVEDTPTKPEEIQERFGCAVRDLVLEVSDDKELEKLERKRIQVEKAPTLSPRAKLIKIADKIANLKDLASSPPASWSLERQTEYVEWSNSVVAGCLGHSEPLQDLYYRVASDTAMVLKRAS
jgi:guanosine-3',5'-bis(diphosphate) 3'-pyrophosphohydrolase